MCCWFVTHNIERADECLKTMENGHCLCFSCLVIFFFSFLKFYEVFCLFVCFSWFSYYRLNPLSLLYTCPLVNQISFGSCLHHLLPAVHSQDLGDCPGASKNPSSCSVQLKNVCSRTHLQDHKTSFLFLIKKK